jgi:hypothetical protein
MRITTESATSIPAATLRRQADPPKSLYPNIFRSIPTDASVGPGWV